MKVERRPDADAACETLKAERSERSYGTSRVLVEAMLFASQGLDGPLRAREGIDI